MLNGSRRAAAAAATSKDAVFTDWGTSTKLSSERFTRPTGVWPSEGSVSDAVVPLIAKAGFRWMATDEMILANTLGTTFGRDGSGRVEQAHRLYHRYLDVAPQGALAPQIDGAVGRVLARRGIELVALEGAGFGE